MSLYKSQIILKTFERATDLHHAELAECTLTVNRRYKVKYIYTQTKYADSYNSLSSVG